MALTHIIHLPTLADLKAQKGNDGNVVLLLGRLSRGDNMGGFYYWDDVSTDTEDLVYYNTVIATGVTTGRWKRLFTRNLVLPQGMLFINGAKKELFVTTVTDANGEATINLTYENTPTGTSIFSQILFNDSKAKVNSTNDNDSVNSSIKSETLKVTTHKFTKGKVTSGISIGITIGAFDKPPVNTPVTFKVEGI